MSQARRALPGNFGECLWRNAGSRSGPLRVQNIIARGPRRAQSNSSMRVCQLKHHSWTSRATRVFPAIPADVSAEAPTFYIFKRMSQARRALPGNVGGLLERNAGSRSEPPRVNNILTCGSRRFVSSTARNIFLHMAPVGGEENTLAFAHRKILTAGPASKSSRRHAESSFS